MSDHLACNGVENSDREESETDHKQTGDGAAVESHAERFRARAAGRLRGAHIRQDRDAHADIAGHERTKRPNQEADRGRASPVLHKEKEENKNHRGDGADGDDLAIEISLGAFLDGSGDFLHAGVAGRGLADGENEEEREDQARDSAEHRNRDARGKKR